MRKGASFTNFFRGISQYMYMVALQGKYFIRELGIVRKSNPNI